MPNYKLEYFDARAKGEPARMVFALVGQKYEDVRFDLTEWAKIKGDKKRFPLGGIPVLDVDGEVLTQSRAICRFIARQFPSDYYGKNNMECARIDEILGIVADIEIAVAPAFDTPDATKREADFVKCRDSTLKPSYDFFSESLKKGEGKYFIGNRITIADVVMFNAMDLILDTTIGLKTYFEPYPTLVKFYESFKNDSPLTQYLKDRQYNKY